MKNKKIIAAVVVLIEVLVVLLVWRLYYTQKTNSIGYEALELCTNLNDEVLVIKSKDFLLKKGVYIVNVNYNSNSYEAISTMEAASGSAIDINVERNVLLPFQHQITYRVYIKSEGMISLVNETNVNAELEILNASIDYQRSLSAFYFAGNILIVFILLDLCIGLYFCCKNGLIKQEHVMLCFIIILTSLPLTLPNVLHGHDVRFHIFRIAGLAEGMRNGDIPVRLQPNWLNGYGAATGVTYPDLLLYPFAGLYLVGMPLYQSYKCYVLFINIATVCVSYYSFFQIGKIKNLALICSFIYSFSMWRLIDLYTRAALGEYTALLFLPLIVLGLYEIYYTEKVISYSLIIGVTGIVTCHPLTVILVAEIIILFLILQLPKTLYVNNIFKMLKNGVFLLLINMGIILPIIDYYLNEGIGAGSVNTTNSIQKQGIYFAQLFTHDYLIGGNSVSGGIAQEMPLTMGMAFLAVILLAILMLLTKKELKNQTLLIQVTILDLLVIYMSTAYFPYEWLLKNNLLVYKIIAAIQFPWRYLTVATIISVVLFYLLVLELSENTNYKNIMCGVIIGISLLQGIDYYSQEFNNETRYYSYLTDANMDTFGDVDNFALAGMDREQMQDSTLKLSDIEMAVSVLDKRGTNYTIEALNTTKDIQYIELPVAGYRYYRVNDNGITLDQGNNRRLRVNLPAGYEGTFTVKYVEPWYWRVSEIISIIVLLVLIVKWVLKNSFIIKYRQ